MDEVPFGFRLPEDHSLFEQPSDDPALTPDRVSPAIEGYFRIPAVWIGDAPQDDAVRCVNPAVHHQIVLTMTLKCGIEARVQRDGTFWFDFATWAPAPQIVIPGYRRPDPEGPWRIPRFHQEADDQAEEYAVVRARVMNAHQACLTSSEAVVRGRGAMMGFPVTVWSTEKGISWRALRTYQDDTENVQALARNFLNNSCGIRRDRPLARRSIELEVVKHSLQVLDGILIQGNASLIQLVETAYMAACRGTEKRFGEALTLAWSVCEQIIFLIWTTYLNDTSNREGTGPIPKDRRERLAGRDYTAAIIIETLELAGRLDRDTYRMLDLCRRARNKWVHQLKSPKESDANLCIRAAQTLLQRTFDVHLRLQAGGRGGVPKWPVWIWEQVKTDER